MRFSSARTAPERRTGRSSPFPASRRSCCAPGRPGRIAWAHHQVQKRLRTVTNRARSRTDGELASGWHERRSRSGVLTGQAGVRGSSALTGDLRQLRPMWMKPGDGGCGIGSSPPMAIVRVKQAARAERRRFARPAPTQPTPLAPLTTSSGCQNPSAPRSILLGLLRAADPASSTVESEPRIDGASACATLGRSTGQGRPCRADPHPVPVPPPGAAPHPRLDPPSRSFPQRLSVRVPGSDPPGPLVQAMQGRTTRRETALTDRRAAPSSVSCGSTPAVDEGRTVQCDRSS